jgi:shikimate kinase
MVCLTGFMGSGKTTIGRQLAARLGWHFVDLDFEIERQTGLSIVEIFEKKGEAVFRDIEHECLIRILGQSYERAGRVVLGLGAGTFVQPRNVAVIRNLGAAQPPEFAASGPGGIVVVWLDCPIEHLLQRCALMGGRPLFRNESSFRQLYLERLPYYQKADYRVESGGEPALVVGRILALGIFGPAIGALANDTAPDMKAK